MSEDTPVALVTGGGTGIGAACCRALAREGFRVAVHYRSSAEKANKLVAELPEAFGVQADLTDSESIDALIATMKDDSGYSGIAAPTIDPGIAKGTPSVMFVE